MAAILLVLFLCLCGGGGGGGVILEPFFLSDRHIFQVCLHAYR